MSDSKKCGRCGESKPLSLFSVARREKDGIQSWCKECCFQANKDRREKLKREGRTDGRIVDHALGGVEWCSGCKTNLPVSKFGRRAGRCKACACALAKQSRIHKIEREKHLHPDHPKKCGTCGEMKALRDFHLGNPRCRACHADQVKKYEERYPERKKARSKKYIRENKEKISESRKRHRSENPEWWREWNKKYSKTEKGRASRVNIAHRRRMAIKSGGVTTDEMVEIERAAGGACHYCGVKGMKLTFDHVIPIAKGGKHEADNLVMACFACNRRKGARDPVEYAKSIGRLLV